MEAVDALWAAVWALFYSLDFKKRPVTFTDNKLLYCLFVFCIGSNYTQIVTQRDVKHASTTYW